MKKFDKGYIYSGLLSDLFGSIIIVFIFLKDFFLNEESNPEDIRAAIPFFIIGFAIVYLSFIVYRILYYKTSGYELTENEIKCSRGVLFRKRSVLDYKKVHAINKKQNLFHRLFGVAVLTIDSGSTNTSHQAEITIIEKDKIVDSLLNELNALKEGGVRNTEETQPKDELLLSEDDSLYSFTSGKKMLYTLINIASTAFFTVLFAMLAVIVLSICKLMIQQSFLGTWGHYFLYALLITVGAILLFSTLSFIVCLIQSFVGYYKFKITRRGNDIQISYGLLERHINTFSYDRIKAVKITQGLVQRMLGFASIRLEVIGYTVNSGDDDKNAGLGVLVPFCKYDEIGEILKRILPDFVPDERQAKSISYFSYISWFSFFLGIIICVVLLQTILSMMIFKVSASTIIAVAFAIIGAGVIILAVKSLISALSYQNNGLAINNGKITAYYGGLIKNVTVFSSKNLIAVENVTTPLRYKAGITSLIMHLKTNALSNEIEVHIQKNTLSDDLERLLIV